jgi:hypothetical protein
MTHDIRHSDVSARLPPGIELGFDGLRLGGPAGAVA